MKTLTQTLTEYVAGCFTGIWIESREPQEAIREIQQLCLEQSWQLGTWNIDQGLLIGENKVEDASDPISAVKAAGNLACRGTSIFVLENFHRFINSTEIMQAMVAQLLTGKQMRSIVVVLAPKVDLPAELEKLFVVVEHALPDRDQLRSIAEGVGTEEGDLPSGEEFERVLDASSGLTRNEAESAYSLSIVRYGRIAPQAVWEMKTQTLKKSGSLELYRGNANFDTLGGMSAVKDFCRSVLSGTDQAVKARGIMLLSPPGCGKTQLCKALGSETGRPVVILNVGALMGSLVGQTEERTRQALNTIDAMGRAVVLLDEVEKSLAGVSGSTSDSGVSSRMFGTFLSWLNDRESDTFVVCTANDVSRLPPEFARAERFDAVFFLDLPNRKEKDAIWKIYLNQYSIDPDQPKPEDKDWTGAEIKACCRLSVLLNQSLVDAAKNVMPVAATASESIASLRNWASGRCIDASKGGIYQSSKTKRRRNLHSVGPAPSSN